MEQSSAAKDEMDKLSRQYAALLGHQNHKQKIHHVRQLKVDNSALREVCMCTVSECLYVKKGVCEGKHGILLWEKGPPKQVI